MKTQGNPLRLPLCLAALVACLTLTVSCSEKDNAKQDENAPAQAKMNGPSDSNSPEASRFVEQIKHDSNLRLQSEYGANAQRQFESTKLAQDIADLTVNIDNPDQGGPVATISVTLMDKAQPVSVIFKGPISTDKLEYLQSDKPETKLSLEAECVIADCRSTRLTLRRGLAMVYAVTQQQSIPAAIEMIQPTSETNDESITKMAQATQQITTATLARVDILGSRQTLLANLEKSSDKARIILASFKGKLANGTELPSTENKLVTQTGADNKVEPVPLKLVSVELPDDGSLPRLALDLQSYDKPARFRVVFGQEATVMLAERKTRELKTDFDQKIVDAQSALSDRDKQIQDAVNEYNAELSQKYTDLENCNTTLKDPNATDQARQEAQKQLSDVTQDLKSAEATRDNKIAKARAAADSAVKARDQAERDYNEAQQKSNTLTAQK